MPLAFSEAQLEQIKTFACQVHATCAANTSIASPSCCRATLAMRTYGGQRTRAVHEVMHAVPRGEECALGPMR